MGSVGEAEPPEEQEPEPNADLILSKKEDQPDKSELYTPLESVREDPPPENEET
jgi:hypothetical protein